MEVAQKAFSEEDTPAPRWSIAEPPWGLRSHSGCACHMMPVMKGLVWSAIVLPLLALTGLAEGPVEPLCRRGRKGEADHTRTQECPGSR